MFVFYFFITHTFYRLSLDIAAVERFELLNSGYWATNAVSTIDSLLSNHLSEVAIAMDTLSTNIQFTHDSYDEQQIQCALEVLVLAGGTRRDLESFDQKTRDRLRVLAGRMEADAEMESSLDDTSGVSALPDSLSASEIETFIAKAVCTVGYDSATSPKAELLRLSQSSKAGTAVLLFPDSVESLARLIKSCQSFVFDVCSAIPMKSLNDMTSLPIWSQGVGLWSSDTDSYGMIPQSYITQVGEHMLDLVQAFEPFASSSDALQLANLAMDGIKNIALVPWKEFAVASNCVDTTDAKSITSLLSGQSFNDHVLSRNTDMLYENEDSGQEEEDADSPSAIFCNQWLDVICSAVTGRLLERTMRINRLSPKGCEHLSVDLNYLVNVLSALGVSGHPHPLLSHVVEIIKLEPKDLQTRFLASKETNLVPKSMQQMEKRLALMRNVDV